MDGVQSSTVSLINTCRALIRAGEVGAQGPLVHQTGRAVDMNYRDAVAQASSGGHVGSAAEGNGQAAYDPEGQLWLIRSCPAAPVSMGHMWGGLLPATIIDPVRSPESAPQPLLQLVLFWGPLVGAAFYLFMPSFYQRLTPEHMDSLVAWAREQRSCTACGIR